MSKKPFIIQDIIESIVKNRVRITDHSDEKAQADELSFDEIYYSVIHGEIIETHADDIPYPGCLILGYTFKGEPVHSVWAYNKTSKWAVIITVYRPDPKLGINWKERR